MTANSASAESPAAHLHRAATQDGAMLYDVSRIGNATEAVFDAQAWVAIGAATPTTAGRGGAWYLQSAERAWVLRHYRRGGWMARITADRYLWTGEERTRPFRECRLLAELHRAGLPVPAPVAARYRRGGLTYAGDLITERLAGAQPVSILLTTQTLPRATWAAIGGCVRRFHAAGVFHADLNAHNILLRANAVYLIDFDRGERRTPGGWCAANLARLKRSLQKISGGLPPERFTAADWQAVLEGYAAGAAPVANAR